jgi:hypothetical protein
MGYGNDEQRHDDEQRMGDWPGRSGRRRDQAKDQRDVIDIRGHTAGKHHRPDNRSSPCTRNDETDVPREEMRELVGNGMGKQRCIETEAIDQRDDRESRQSVSKRD